MKKQLFAAIAALLCFLPLSAQSLKGDINEDGVVDVSDVTMLVDLILNPTVPSTATNGHEYVDLGLPSRTLWATCNVGANYPQGFGDYFAWGETTGYYGGRTDCTWNTYKWCNGDEYSFTKYCGNSERGDNGFVDNLTSLELADDAARANWGGNWRTPTPEEWEELCNPKNCTWTAYKYDNEEFNGISGYKVESNKEGYEGRFIFLPAAGSVSNSEFSATNNIGIYMSSDLATDYQSVAHSFFFNVWAYTDPNGHDERCKGMSVRPVISYDDVSANE